MNDKVCTMVIAGGLDTPFRKLFQDPQKILKPYVRSGMTVLDFGCGPGFFTIEIAKMLSDSGTVIAVDLQDGMLERIRQKIRGTNLEKRIALHKCEKNNIGIIEKVDFVLLFWMIHEVPDFEKLIEDLMGLLNNDGKILIAEPKVHVTKKAFNSMIAKIHEMKIKSEEGPKIFFSRTVLLSRRLPGIPGGFFPFPP
jgi:ubiquinone/menaquinone biosynthesis C-methylase UbiE